MEQKYLSNEQTAEYIGMSKLTLYLWAENGTIPAYKFGRVWRIDREELDNFIKQKNGICYNDDACRRTGLNGE